MRKRSFAPKAAAVSGGLPPGDAFARTYSLMPAMVAMSSTARERLDSLYLAREGSIGSKCKKDQASSLEDRRLRCSLTSHREPPH